MSEEDILKEFVGNSGRANLDKMIEKLRQMVEVVAWLDSARWSPENQSASSLGQPVSSLNPAQSVLVHWLTYITDIQRPWQYVWRVGEKVFTEIVRDYSEHEFPIDGNISETRLRVSDFLDNYRGERKPKKVRPFKYKGVEYRPRFPNQHEFIERTLTILAHRFSRNFLRFIGDSIIRWKTEKNGLRNVARDLYFLTYSDYSAEKTVDFLEGKISYPSWDRFGFKRLWAALRDYRKSREYLEIFRIGLREEMGYDIGSSLFEVWTSNEEFGLHLLELPGDVWNIDFSQRVVIPIAKKCGISVKKSWGTSRIAREVYNTIEDKKFYPEQLDISWALSAKACENAICDLCPFSKYDLQKICLKGIPEAKDKYCPIVLATCQFRLICDPRQCPISDGKGIGLCEGIT